MKSRFSMIEDADGNALPLVIEYPLPVPALYFSLGALVELHPIGSVVAIKEPWVRFGPYSVHPEICVTVPVDAVQLYGDGGVTWKHGNPVSFPCECSSNLNPSEPQGNRVRRRTEK